MKQTRKPVLTIGMATFDDFEGVYFTITSLMVHHADVLRDCEIVVVDNNPQSRQGRLVKEWIQALVPQGRYFAFEGPSGTAQSRNEVFRRAQGAFVLCIDCHVLLVPGAVRKLIDYSQAHPDCRDLLSGPLVLDSGRLGATHQKPKWSRGAWGVWALDPRGNDPHGEPFEIWQQGMGLFSCRKDAWVGFHPEFRGFGGCESYVAEKFRQSGGRVLCCPWLRWTHRFQRPHGVPYAIDNQERLRNYVIGFQELGLDLQPVLDHFKVSRAHALALIAASHQAAQGSEFAIVGDRTYGGVKMRGHPLAKHLACSLVDPQRVQGMARSRTIIAIKAGSYAKTLRHRCDRLVYDPLDVFVGAGRGVRPVDYWRSKYEELRFNEILATSPACYEVMREALPGGVSVHMVPHPCDPRIDASWRHPDGPVVYSGLAQFIASGLDRIKQACRMIGRDFIAGTGCDVLQGASLALALRLPPYNTEMNRRCKPQIKLENAAAAGLPAVSTDCPAATSLHPAVRQVPADFSASQLARAMQEALEGPRLSDPFRERDYLADMDRILGRRQSLVVYTAIFGGYDELHDPRERTPGVDYICFTDNPRLKSNVWRICYCRPIGDPSLQAKKCKILAHEMLRCAVSLWIDGRIELHSLNGAMSRIRTDLALMSHPARNCIYAEADHCKRARRGDPRRIDEAVRRYKAEGHPPAFGLWMGGVIFRRHTPAISAFNRQWWQEVTSGTSRDQISLPVVLRRLRIPFETLPTDALRHRINSHAK